MFLQRNQTNDNVKTLQQALVNLGYDIEVDGFFGEETEATVANFQHSMKLNADGIAGPVTLEKLKLDFSAFQYPVVVPSGYAEIIETFGDPLVDGYAKASLDFCAVPKELEHVFGYKHPTTGKNGFFCHRKLVITFTNVYSKIAKLGLASELKTFDGCYNLRNVRGRKNLSTHSWAIAVDHNASTNPLGAVPTIDKGIVQVFKSEGFVWGGDFKRQDGQHFQYAQNY